MPGPTATYDPAKHIITFKSLILTGFFSGTFLAIDRAEDTWKLKVGADGEKARAKNNNKSGIAILTLMQTSPTNDALSAVQTLDELTGAGIGVFSVRDVLGTTKVICSDAYILKPAKIERGDEVLATEWSIVLPTMDQVVGGAIPIG